MDPEHRLTLQASNPQLGKEMPGKVHRQVHAALQMDQGRSIPMVVRQHTGLSCRHFPARCTPQQME